MNLKLSNVVPEKYFIYIPDNIFLRLLYLQRRKRWPRTHNPQTFSEKMTWIKMYGHLENFGMYADKYAVRDFVKQTIGEKYLIPIIGNWDRFEDVPLDELPEQFVLKATHGSGYNYICKDKSKLDKSELQREASRWLSENFYTFFREQQYKYLRPRLICEQYMEDESGELRDYKISCFNGIPRTIEFHYDRSNGGHKVAVYDTEWRKMPFTVIDGTTEDSPKPDNLADLVNVAEKLSKNLPYARVDLYSVHGAVYFGEISFTPLEGLPYIGVADVEMGKMLDLSGFKK